MSFSFFWPLNCFPHFAILMWLILKAKCDNVILQIKIDIAMF